MKKIQGYVNLDSTALDLIFNDFQSFSVVKIYLYLLKKSCSAVYPQNLLSVSAVLIAEEVKISRKTVLRGLVELENMGLITRIERSPRQEPIINGIKLPKNENIEPVCPIRDKEVLSKDKEVLSKDTGVLLKDIRVSQNISTDVLSLAKSVSLLYFYYNSNIFHYAVANILDQIKVQKIREIEFSKFLALYLKFDLEELDLAIENMKIENVHVLGVADKLIEIFETNEGSKNELKEWANE